MNFKKLFIITIITAIALIVLLLYFKSRPHELHLKKATFSSLPGWGAADTVKSFATFQVSCKTFLKQDPNEAVGSEYIDLQVKDWLPACNRAQSIDGQSQKETKHFFETWFMPVEFFYAKRPRGLFTGYYMPLLKGSLTKTERFNVPLYGLPKKLITANLALFKSDLKNRKIVGRVKNNQLIPFYTREEINQGSIAKFTPVIAWVDSLIDRSFLEIQGSGIIQLLNGKQIVVGYAGQNGAPYTAIAKVLIDKGVMTKDNASMQHIRKYLEAHPDEINAVLNQNKSFIFFSILPEKAALGSQGVPLTPGYSIAIDRQWVPLGVPIWLSTTRPRYDSEKQQTFERLMIAQDTGGAIKGVVRGDVYWGAGERATSIAGKMKNYGHYWLLLPRHLLEKLNQ